MVEPLENSCMKADSAQDSAKIVIEDDLIRPYSIAVNPHGGYIIVKEVLHKDGTVRYINDSYPSTLSGALTRIAKEKTHDSLEGKVSLETYVKTYEKVVSQITNLIQA